MRRLARALACAVLLVVGPGTITARGEAAGAAAGFVSSVGNEVIAILREDRSNGERERRLADVLGRAFNLKSIARFVLGRHWARATPAQRAAYLELFPRYVIEIYSGRFTGYAGERFDVVGQRRLGRGVDLVSARIVRAGGPPLNVTFRVEQVDGSPAIIDVMVEGVSLLLTKRSEFDSFARREGLQALINRLRRIVSSRPASAG